MTDISLSSIRRLMKKAGANRISQDAIEYMRQLAENYIMDISKIAIELAEHAKRRTILKEDVEKAYKIFVERRV